jgi:hypothetical protein
MANHEMQRTELLLQLIADELYMARIDREHEGTSKSDWHTGGGRDLWEKGIEQLREKIEKLPE